MPVRISFKDGPDKLVSPGGYAQIAAKRRYGFDTLKTGDPEVILFSVFVELHGAAEAKRLGDAGFDKWLETVGDTFDIVDKDGKPLTLGELDPSQPGSTATSPESPPTSD